MNESTGTNTWNQQGKIPRLVISPAQKKAKGESINTGEYYKVYFPFSSTRKRLSPAGWAFEKAVVYGGLIFLLAAIAISIPYFVVVSFVKEKASRSGWWMFLPYFVGQVLIKELSVCLGFVTIPTLMLSNIFRGLVLLIHPAE